MRFRDIRLPKNPECPACGTRPTITALHEYAGYCEYTGSAQRENEVSARELRSRLDAGNAPFILDVREPFEHAESRIPDSVLIPLGELPRRLGELDPSLEMVVHCKSGGRSARAIALLREKGFTRASNLSGGITSWLKELQNK